MLLGATLPRESRFKIGFYVVIVRPLFKIIERNSKLIDDDEQTIFLREAALRALYEWGTIEENLTTRVKNLILDTIEKKAWYGIEEWE